ncbi:MAG: peptidylprolyl isomerase [Verrucomicrobia bacterium]|nr:peptidylprolyl isomerase [Verrucomicrobiota bacterium]
MFVRWICGGFLFAAAASGLAGTLAQFRTVFGDIAVELYDQDKPATVQNFIRYVQSGRYTNGFSHRLIPGFVLQAGGYVVTNRGAANWDWVAVATDPPVTNEFTTGKFYSNVFGTIAMAKTIDPNSATSQFFFNLADNSASLDSPANSGGFTVFGRVIAGTNALAMFNRFQNWIYPYTTVPQLTNLVLYEYFNPPFDTLPLLNPSLVDSNQLFLDITLLKIEVAAKADHTCDISWNSVAGLTNRVEFTTNFPAVWQLLHATNGSGGMMTTTDTTTNASPRFYRVRVAD